MKQLEFCSGTQVDDFETYLLQNRQFHFHLDCVLFRRGHMEPGSGTSNYIIFSLSIKGTEEVILQSLS